MASKQRAVFQWPSFLKRPSRELESIRIPEWSDYVATQQNIVPAIRGLTSCLVMQLYSKESGIVDVVVDQLLDEYGPQPLMTTENQKTIGLGLGNIADLGTVEAFSFAALVMLEVATMANTNSKTIAEVVRELPRHQVIYENLLLRAQENLGIDSKSARRLMDTTLDVIDPQFKFVRGQTVSMEEHRYCEFKKINSEHPINRIKDYAYEYIAGFLNRRGGRIYFGITDKDRIVKGEALSSQQRDELRQRIVGRLKQLTPPVSPDCYRINFHPILNDRGDEIPDLVVVEIIVPLALDRPETRTDGGRKIVKSECGIARDCK